MKSRYTFILDYLGGTYLAQVEAENIQQATHTWVESLNIDEIKDFTKQDQDKIIEKGFVDEEPTPINGMQNVWCFLINTGKGTGLVNFVKTSTD